jgi:hypothetical protein
MTPVTRGAMQGPRCQTRHPGPAATTRSHRDCGWRTRSTARPGSNPSFLPHTTRFPRPRMAIVNRPEARPDDKQARLKAAYSRATHAVSPKSCPYRAGNRIYNFLILRITANDEQATFVRIRSPASGAARCRIADGRCPQATSHCLNSALSCSSVDDDRPIRSVASQAAPGRRECLKKSTDEACAVSPLAT